MVASWIQRVWTPAILACMIAGPATAQSKLESDWSRLMGDLLPAIQACIAQPAVPVDRVLKAWPMDQGMAGVRLRSPDGHRFDCIAPLLGGVAERLTGLMPEAGKVPGEGDPIFFPMRESPPPMRVELLEQVVDAAGNVQGWLSYTRGGPNDPGPRLRGAWRLEKIGARDFLGSVKPPLIFTTDGSLRGETGCNRITGRFEVTGDALKVGRLATTRRACAKPMMAQERRLIDSLRRAARWKIDDDKLILVDEQGTALMRLLPETP